MKAIERAVEAAGSQTALAKELGITPQAVSAWVDAGCVPLPRMKDVSALTGISIGDLLMDIQVDLEAPPAE
jgi:DNA-binding transcriptional regulator YdaS (Cro superfamily)